MIHLPRSTPENFFKPATLRAEKGGNASGKHGFLLTPSWSVSATSAILPRGAKKTRQTKES